MDYITYNILFLHNSLYANSGQLKIAKLGSIVLFLLELIFYTTYNKGVGTVSLVLLGAFSGAWIIIAETRNTTIRKLNELCFQKYGKLYADSIDAIYHDHPMVSRTY